MVHQNRRRSERIQPFVAPCRYLQGEERVPGFLTDLSRDGGRVHSDAAPPPSGTPIDIELRIARQPTALVLPAVVRWSRAGERGGFVFGVSFEGAGGDERKALEELVDGFLRRAASIV